MSGFLPPNYMEFAIHYTRVGDDRPYVCTVAARTTFTPFPQSDFEEVADAIADLQKSRLHTTESIERVTARQGTAGDPLLYDHATNVAGTQGTSRLPQNCAVLVTKQTGLGGRRNKGRMFFPSIAEGTVDDVGALSGSARTDLQTNFNSLHSILSDGFAQDWPLNQPVILHGDDQEEPTNVTSFLVEPVIATQRRRLRR